jgi:hypothetical protein
VIPLVFEEDKYEEGLDRLLQRIIDTGGEVPNDVICFSPSFRFNKGDQLVVLEPHGVDLKDFSMRYMPFLTLHGEP